MPASYDTVEAVVEVLQEWMVAKRVTASAIDDLLDELSYVEGNRSFKESIDRVLERWRYKHGFSVPGR